MVRVTGTESRKLVLCTNEERTSVGGGGVREVRGPKESVCGAWGSWERWGEGGGRCLRTEAGETEEYMEPEKGEKT